MTKKKKPNGKVSEHFAEADDLTACIEDLAETVLTVLKEFREKTSDPDHQFCDDDVKIFGKLIGGLYSTYMKHSVQKGASEIEKSCRCVLGTLFILVSPLTLMTTLVSKS